MIMVKNNLQKNKIKPQKKLHIAQVAPIEERVPPRKYGGIELVVYNLIQGLCQRGHKVILLASGDSKSAAELVAIFPRSIRTLPGVGNDAKSREIYKVLGLAKSLKYLKSQKFDIIHNHAGWRFLSFANLLNTPLVNTLHGSLDAKHEHVVYKTYAKSNYISISDAQRVPLKKLNYVSTVYNGIDLNKFTFQSKSKDYLAWLGRMSPQKGPKECILAAKRAGEKLIMAGKVDLVDQDYFKKEIEPLIDGKQIKYIGEVGEKEKNKLLGGAKALLALIQWREPFGLFIVEALACGTPVIATSRGSVPELIKDKKNGFIVKNWKEAAKAVEKIDTISRQDCRKRAEDKFNIKQMVNGYLDAYYKIVNK